MGIVTIIIILVAIVVAIIAFTEVNRRKRQQAIAAFASKLSLEYQPHASPESLGIYAPFPLLSKGSSRSITNVVLADTQETTARLFDYSYVTGSGKNRRTNYFSVVYFKSEKLKLPEFTLSPEYFYHRIGRAFGLQDINFDTHPKFSATFILQGSNETSIRKFMTDKRLNELENYPNILIDADQSRCLIYRSSRVSVTDYEKWLSESFAIFSILCEVNE